MHGNSSGEGGQGAQPDAAARIDNIFQNGVARHNAGRHMEAAVFYRKVLDEVPEHAEAMQLLGLAAHQAGRRAEAKSLMERSIVLSPDVAWFHNNMGEVLRALDNHEAALASYRRAVELDPSYAEAASNLGVLCFGLGRFEESAMVYEAALAAGAAPAKMHFGLGMARLSTGDFAGAAESFGRVVELEPGNADANGNLGACLLRLGDESRGRFLLEEAIRLDPASVEAHYNLALLHIEHARFDSAEERLRAALAAAPDNADCHAVLGFALLEQGQVDAAEAAARRALEIEPRHLDAATALGVAATVRGRFDDARSWFRKVLAVNPADGKAWLNIARFRGRSDDSSADIERIEALLARPGVDDRARSDLHFALGKLYDDEEIFEKAFAHFEAGNRLHRAGAPYDGAANAAQIDEIIEVFDAEFLERAGSMGVESELPVFVVGMPRSGTTLIEQVLAAHPLVHGAGELGDVRRLVSELPRQLGASEPYPRCARDLDAVSARVLAEHYLSALRERSPDALRVVDKMPGNYRHLGLLATLFPNARIVHCRRDPMDVGLSLYTTPFAVGHEYAYDFADIGAHQRAFDRLMQHWDRVLGGRVLTVDYEALVADLEGESRRLVSHCGLEWDPGCLEFHHSDRPVHTASSWQVRQPVFTSSVGRWRRYEPWLGPLRDALENPPGGQ